MKEGSFKTIKLMIEYAKDINLNIQDYTGKTAFHYLALRYTFPVMDAFLTSSLSILLKHGADSTITDNYGISAINILSPQLIDYLLNYNIDFENELNNNENIFEENDNSLTLNIPNIIKEREVILSKFDFKNFLTTQLLQDRSNNAKTFCDIFNH